MTIGNYHVEIDENGDLIEWEDDDMYEMNENGMRHYWVSYYSLESGEQSGCTITAKDDDEFERIWKTEYAPHHYEIAECGCFEDEEDDVEITAADLHDYMYGI